MRAYRCDACRKMFMLPDNSLNFSGIEDDGLDDCHIPGNIYIYHSNGVATSLDLCKDCLEKVVLTIERIGGNTELKKTIELFYKDEVHE